MRQVLFGLLCGMTLSGCITVNGGNKPMGSIIGRTNSNTQTEKVAKESDQSVVQHLVAAVPGRH